MKGNAEPCAVVPSGVAATMRLPTPILSDRMGTPLPVWVTPFDADQRVVGQIGHICSGILLRNEILRELAMLGAWDMCPGPSMRQPAQLVHNAVHLGAWGICPWQLVVHRITQPCELAVQTQIFTPGRY